MACQIKRNTEGKVVDVLDSTGESSKLFRDIHGTLFLADTDTSLKIYANAYSDSVQKMFEGNEPELRFRAKNKVYDNLEELLINETDGDISIGFVNPSSGEFMEVASMSSQSGKAKHLVDLVRQGFISAERVLMEDGSTRYMGKGEFATTRNWTASVAVSELEGRFGRGEYEVFEDGSFTVKVDKDFTEVTGKDGKKRVVRKVDIPKLVQDGELADPVIPMIEYINEFDNPRPVDRDKPVSKKTKTDEQGIKAGLLSFLKGIGFSTTTLENYRKNYNTKYGEDPSIRALADIANQVVAVDPSNISDLSEEVAHIAIEMYSDQNSIAAALASVHNTPEYSEFYDRYKEKYSEFYEGVELEDQVRKEILGKILKKTILENFSTVNKTEAQSYVIEKLREIWGKVYNYISNRLTPHHYRSIEILNERISNSIFNNTSEDFQADISSNENFFYNLMDDDSKSIEKELKVAKRSIEDLYRSALVESVPNQAELDRLSEVQDEYNLVSSINTVVGIAAHQMDILKLNVEDATKNNEVLSMKDASRYLVLKANLVPTINNLKSSLKKVKFSEDISKKFIENIIKASDEVVVNLSAIEPLMTSDYERVADEILDKILANTELTEEQKEQIRSWGNGDNVDITVMGKSFGLASHLKNPIMQLIYNEVTGIITRVATKFNSKFNDVVNKVDEKDMLKYQKPIIKKGTHFFISPINEAAYQKDLKEQQNKILANMVGKEVKDIEALRGKKKGKFSERDVLKTDDAIKEYKERVKEWKESEGIERRNSDTYYKDREARFDKANTSEDTRKYLSSKNAARYDRLKKYTNPDGTIDASKQTASERIQDNSERKAYLSAKSPYDSAGNIKPGLRVVSPEELTESEKSVLTFEVGEDFVGEIVTLEKGVSSEDLTLESRRALDLFNLDMLFREESASKSREGKPLQQFVDKMKDIEGKEGSAFDWVLDNASINLTNEYYDNLGSPVVFNDVAQEYVDSLEDADERRTKQVLLDRLIELQRSRKALLKQNKYANSAVETDVHHMTSLTRNGIIELDSEISDTRSALNVPFELQELVDQPFGETALNEDYQKMFVESGLSEFQFALQHMTEKNSVKTRDFAIQIDDIITGKRTRVKDSYDEFIQNMVDEGKLEGLSREEATQVLKNEFAKRHVGSYFRRFQPSGYSQALNKLKTGEIKTSDLVEDRKSVIEANPEFQFIEISPDYSWSEDLSNMEYKNPNYKEGLATRPRLDKYLDDEFFTRYGIDKSEYLALEKDDLASLTPTKNIEEYEFLKMMVSINEEAIELLGETGRVSKYQRPQISKSGFEQTLNVISRPRSTGANAKDMLSDIFKSKIDEKEYGEEVDGLEPSDISVKIVPKYYQNQLESPDIVTENTLQAVMVNYKAALKYKERVDAERSVKALEHKISNQRFKNRGFSNGKSKILKKGEVSNYYKKTQEMVDQHLYGIRQNRQLKTTVMGKEVDLTQIFNSITKYVAFNNLAFNPIVDLTSWTTGVYNNILDTAAQDFYSKSAAKKATRNLPKMIATYIAESGKVNKQSELSHLMEFYKVLDAEDKLGESAVNRMLRLTSRSSFGLSKMANLPVTPKNMLSILYDHKFYNGRFMSFNDFVRAKKASKKDWDMKAIKAEWSGMEETLYDNLNIDPKKGVRMGSKFRDKFDNPQQEFDDLQLALVRKISQVNQSVDSIVSEADRTMAQRDVLLSSMMLHRSWILTNLTRKFKGEHFNIATGQIESGQYRTILRTTRDMVKTIGKKGAYREMVRNMQEHDLRNFRKTRAELIALTILVGLTNALLAADDDDDTFIENMAQLIALRTTSESQSASFSGIPGTLIETYESPLIQARYAENVWKTFSKMDGKYLLNNTLYKRKYQFGDLQKQITSYRHFNIGTLIGIGEE